MIIKFYFLYKRSLYADFIFFKVYVTPLQS